MLERPDELCEGGRGREACLRVARVVARLAALPAVPVRDWLDRAAAALSAMAEGSICVALMARVGAQGSAVAHGSAGVGGAADQALAGMLRAGVRRMHHAGLTPVAGGACVRVGMPEEWLASALGRQLGPATVVGAATIEGGWTLLAYVASGLEPQTAAAVLEAVLPLAAAAAARALGPALAHDSWLTRQEQGVLELVVRGMSDREAGAVLGRSPHTVHEHVKSLHQKLGTRRRAELAARYFGGP